jgi:peroxiredoxin
MNGLEGRKAPNFSLEGDDGKTHSLNDYLGKTVVLGVSKDSVASHKKFVADHKLPSFYQIQT